MFSADDQLPNDVIEGGPQVVNDFPYMHAPHWIGLTLDTDVGREYLSVSIEIDGASISLASVPICCLARLSFSRTPKKESVISANAPYPFGPSG